MRYSGRTVEALDARGRRLWAYTCPSPVRTVVRGRFLPGGREGFAAVSAPSVSGGVREEAPGPSAVVVLDTRGRAVTQLFPEDRVGARVGLPPPLLVPSVTPLDLDGDGTDEVVVTAHHRVMAPAFLFVYWPQAHRWAEVLEHTGGWIFDVTSVPGASPPRLRFLAFNGELGSFEAVGELVVPPPDRPAPAAGRTGISGALASEGADLSWYTPLAECWPGPATGEAGFRVQPDGSLRLEVRTHRWVVDRWGNPVPGPNAGRDLADLRMRFLRTVSAVRVTGFLGNPEAAERLHADLAGRFAPLVREPPLRAVLDLTAARVLAAAGEPERGADLLARTWRETGFGGVGLELAHLEALSGRFRRAEATLRELAAEGRSPAGVTRAPELLRRIAIELGDAALLRDAIPLSPDFTARAELREAAWARARLWWDEAGPGDGEVRSHDLVPAADAVACLVRWRLGLVTPEDVNRMTASLRRNPEAAPEILIARAMARLATGDPSGALADLDRAGELTAARALHDFRADQVRRLVDACQVLLLARTGRLDRARWLAHELTPRLRPGHLPARLVREALAGTHPRRPLSG